jgi:hypothetical protein
VLRRRRRIGGRRRRSRAASFAAPHARFVLLAFFSWFDQDRYDTYRPLYVAGKLISAAALAVWVFMTGLRPSAPPA